MGDHAVQVGGVAHHTDQAGVAGEGVGEAEVVEQGPQQPGTGPAPQDDLEGGRFGHDAKVSSVGVRAPHLTRHLTRVNPERPRPRRSMVTR